LTIVSPQDATIVDTTIPDLNTTSEELNISYSWDTGIEIPGCRNCTSYSTTYGEYEHEYDGSLGVNGEPLNNLVGLWHANEDNGFTLYDDSAKGNDGLLNWAIDKKIAEFPYDEPSTHFSDLCYLNAGKSADDPNDDQFLYVYTEYSGFFEPTGNQNSYVSQIKAVHITRRGDLVYTTDPTTVYDSNKNKNDPEYYNLKPTNGRISEMILDPSCYVFNGVEYVAATHMQPDLPDLPPDYDKQPRQHIMLYKRTASGWDKVKTTYQTQEDEAKTSGTVAQSFFALDLFEYNGRLMGFGTYGKERNTKPNYDTPRETKLRVYNFGENPDAGTLDSGSFVYDYPDANYISSPDITKIDNTYYIAYNEAPPVASAKKGAPYNVDIKLITTTDFRSFTPSICVSGNCGAIDSDGNPDSTIENKWPAIAKLPDGRLFVAYASKVARQLDLVYKTSKTFSPPYNEFSDSYGSLGDSKDEEYYATTALNSMGEMVVATQKTTSSLSAKSYFMTDTAKWTSGKFGPGLKLDGVADYVNVGNDPSLKITGKQVTVSAWIRAKSDIAVGNERIVGKGIKGDKPPYYRYLLYRKDGTTELRFGVSTVGAASPTRAIFTPVEAGRWIHVVGVYDGEITDTNNVFIYIDGEPVGRARTPIDTADFNLGDTDEPVVIGANTSVSPPSQSFNGDIDEVMIFNRALDATEIKALYNKTLSEGGHSVTVSARDISGNEVATSTSDFCSRDGASSTACDWYDTEWGYRQKITISKDMTLNTDQTDFPLLVKIPVGNQVFAKAQSSGQDILFTSSDRTTKLYHEIEKFDNTPGNEELVAWVKIPRLSTSTDTVIYMYYGNPNAFAQENPHGVWDSSYKGVWHLKEESAGTGSPALYKDSTGNNNDGDDYISAIGREGQINGGKQFDGINDYIAVPDSPSLKFGTGDFTVSLWTKLDDPGTTQYLINKYPGGGVPGFHVSINSDGALWVMEHGNTLDFSVSGTTKINNSTWHYLTYVRHSNTGYREIWVDGARQANAIYGIDNIDTTDRMVISGRYTNPSTTWAQGKIDEIRLSGTARSADWIKTSYNNQKYPENYTILGTEENVPY
jgi:hypothetical protein